MYGITRIGCGLLLTAALLGCQRTVDTVAVGDSLGSSYNWVQTDGGASRAFKVITARKTRTETGLLKVEVELQNTRKSYERFVYKFEWLDAKGMEINSITNDWQVRVVNGLETVTLTGMAADARVTDCRVKLQKDIR